MYIIYNYIHYKNKWLFEKFNGKHVLYNAIEKFRKSSIEKIHRIKQRFDINSK